jgi:hypothetical protein
MVKTGSFYFRVTTPDIRGFYEWWHRLIPWYFRAFCLLAPFLTKNTIFAPAKITTICSYYQQQKKILQSLIIFSIILSAIT